MFNTPNTFGIFALDTMLSWLQDIGGVEAIASKMNQKKIYDEIDTTTMEAPCRVSLSFLDEYHMEGEHES